MEERRVLRLGESMRTYAEVDRQVIPIVGKCLDGIVKAAESIDQKSVSAGRGFIHGAVFGVHSSTPCRVASFSHPMLGVFSVISELFRSSDTTENSFMKLSAF